MMLKLMEEFKVGIVEVAVRMVCPECLGKRVVQHPQWTLYWEVFGRAGVKRSDSEDEQWFREQGYGDMPDEEMDCWDCDGTGKIEKWVKLEELFEEVGIDFEARLQGLENAELERTSEELMRFNVELYGGRE